MMPPIDGGLAMALARGLADAGLIAAFGAALTAREVIPAAGRPGLRRLVAACVAAALIAPLPWLWRETGNLAGTVDARSLGTVLRATAFGHLLLGRAALLSAAWLAWAAGAGRVAWMLAGLALASEAGLSHARAMDAPWLIATGLAHLLAAGAWLGGLLPLLLVVARAPVAMAELSARRFSWLGAVSVAVLAVTAAWQGWALAGGPAGLTRTAWGTVIGIKLAGFAALAGLAARNRWLLVPALGTRRAALCRAVAAEAGIGLAVVFAAATLAQMAPPMHDMAGAGQVPMLDRARGRAT